MSVTTNTATSKQCDLVMKGGIASGIVYPGALQQLHQAGYQFRSIGGTSAGAIGAGLAAAAQCGGPQGFTRLQEVSNQLAGDGFLLSLFQPTVAEAKTLFALVDAVSTQSTVPARLRAALGQLGGRAGRRPVQGMLLGAALGAAPALLATAVGATLRLDARSGLLGALAGGIVGGVVGHFAGKALGSAEAAPRLVEAALSAEHGFGLCAGHAEGHAAAKSGELSDWLGWAIDYVAGKVNALEVPDQSIPLTLGDLRAQGVDLRAMTSNLSEGRPYPLPFEKKNYLFRESDMRSLLPPHVVDYMVENSYRGPQDDEQPQGKLPDGYYFLPHQDAFPVLLAVRMSLSFPVLIRAVPLYKLTTVGWAKLKQSGGQPDPDTDLRRHWFSDGGLSSNFPMHFFDSWVPPYPTFGINLVAAPSGAEPPTPALQRANPPGEADTWSDVAKLPAFFNAIWSTTQNFRDNLQSQLPSYRERIVPVGLTPEEGGLNLKMKPETVKAVMARGARAGEALAGFDMDHHLWVRYLVLLPLLEENLAQFRDEVGPGGAEFKKLAARQLAARGTDGKYPYSRDPDWCAAAEQRIEQLEAFLQTWAPEHFGEHCPKPPGTLRVAPDI